MTARDRRAAGFFTKWASSTTSIPGRTSAAARGSRCSASNVVTATPPFSRQSANASLRSAPCTGTARRVERARISRVQLISTLAGQTTRKRLSPWAARWASAAMACTVLPSPISSPMTTRFCVSAKRAPNAWYPRRDTRRCVSSRRSARTRSAIPAGRNPSAASRSGPLPDSSASRL